MPKGRGRKHKYPPFQLNWGSPRDAGEYLLTKLESLQIYARMNWDLRLKMLSKAGAYGGMMDAGNAQSRELALSEMTAKRHESKPFLPALKRISFANSKHAVSIISQIPPHYSHCMLLYLNRRRRQRSLAQ